MLATLLLLVVVMSRAMSTIEAHLCIIGGMTIADEDKETIIASVVLLAVVTVQLLLNPVRNG